MELPGVGPDLAEKILEFLRTGKVRKHEELSRKVPRGVLEVMEVPGVGPKTARLLYEGLGIDSLEKLKAALDRGTSPGSKASAPRGRRGSGKASPSPRRRESGGPWGRCSPWREASSGHKGPTRGGKGGALRLGEALQGHRGGPGLFGGEPGGGAGGGGLRAPSPGQGGLRQGEGKGHRLPEKRPPGGPQGGPPRKLRGGPPVPHGEQGPLHPPSRPRPGEGPEAFRVRGLPRGEKDRRGDGGGGLRRLGPPLDPAPLREDQGEVEAALEGRLPKLLELPQVKGDLQVHSTYSDGQNTLEELWEAAKTMGYRYLAVTDHSPAVRVAGGPSPEEALKRVGEIRRFNETHGPPTSSPGPRWTSTPTGPWTTRTGS